MRVGASVSASVSASASVRASESVSVRVSANVSVRVSVSVSDARQCKFQRCVSVCEGQAMRERSCWRGRVCEYARAAMASVGLRLHAQGACSGGRLASESGVRAGGAGGGRAGACCLGAACLLQGLFPLVDDAPFVGVCKALGFDLVAHGQARGQHSTASAAG